MTRSRRPLANLAFVLVAVLSWASSNAWAQSKPLSEDDHNTSKIGIDAETIVDRVQKGGLSFTVDDAAVDRLQTAGASMAVVGRARVIEIENPPAPGAAAITYEDMLKLGARTG
jgi:hypothetical protein